MAYGSHEVPTVGDRILHMAKSMWWNSKYVAIISAVRKRADFKTMKTWGRPIYEKHYHQVYDIEKLELVGRPIPLPFHTDDEDPKAVWAGQDTYVVYADAHHKRVFIVHMDELIDR